MGFLSECRVRLRSVVRRSRVEQELEEEMRDHIDREIAARVARGLSPDVARRTTLVDFGGVQLHREEARRGLGLQLWDDFVADARHGLRSLTREPGFAAAVVLTLALGIGANVVIFSAVDAVLLRPLPYAEQDRLVELVQRDARQALRRDPVSPANFLDWRERASDVVALAAAEPYSRTLTTPEGPERIRCWLVSEGFFQTLKIQPLLGRTFTAEEFTPGRENVAVLGYGTWSRQFGADAGVVGRTVVMDGQPFTIVGVVPAAFAFPPGRDVWSPKIFTDADRRQRASSFYRVVGALKPGVSIAVAQARLDVVGRQMQQEYPREDANVAIGVLPLKESLVGNARPILLVFLVGVGLLLLVACTNVSNLLLVRVLRRRQEFAVRMALGAGVGRVRRQVLTEALIAASLGAVLAIVGARWGVAILRTMVPDTLPRGDQMAVGWMAMVVAFALAFATAIGATVVSLARSRDVDPMEINASGRSVSARRGWLQRGFVVAQLVMAMVLVVTAGLFVRSLTTLLGQERGFRTDRVTAVTLFAWQEYPRPDQRAQYVQRVVDRLESLPGVDGAGAGSSLPLAENIGNESALFTIPGVPMAPGQTLSAQGTVITPGYLEALGMTVRDGRAFSLRDRAESKPVVLVNDRLARQQWPGRSPIGQTIAVRFGGPPVIREIVGVVGDVRRRLAEDPPAALYIPHAQSPTGSVSFVVHTAGDSSSMMPAIRAAIAGINRSIALANVMTLDAVLQATVQPRRFNLQLVAFFAIAALLLASIGTYGVVAYATNERLKEIGIRIALGGTARQVLGLILADGVRLAAVGTAAGLLASVAMSQFVRGMLYGITPLDAPTYVVGALLIVVIALCACGVPAYRASRLDAVKILRAE
jgi:putative ABC transport system permease protein